MPPPPPPRRVMLVDDDRLFLQVATEVLGAAGLDVHPVREPIRAVPEARSFHPDVILLDRVMPVLNGAEVLRSVRAFPDTAAIPVVFVTADRSERELVRSVRAGCVDVLFKPLDTSHAQRLVRVLDELAARPDGPPAPEEVLLAIYQRDRRTGLLRVNPGTPFEGRVELRDGALVAAEFGPLRGMTAFRELLIAEDGLWLFDTEPQRPRPPPRERLPEVPKTPVPEVATAFRPRILLVDDDPELRRLFNIQLTRAGFDVVLAEDGQEAVEQSTRAVYDLVIADLNMPRLDGWGMLRQFKADHRTREIPVIFLSAHDDYRETLRAAHSGAADYLPKIGRADTVLQRVLALLTPRLDVLSVLEARRSFTFHTHQVGVQWLLRVLGKLQATGTLTAKDDWAGYTVHLGAGLPMDARTVRASRESSGLPALAALLVSRPAEGSFSFGDEPPPNRLNLRMEALLQRACDMLNQVEARVTASRLSTTGRFETDPELYALYRRIAPDTGLRLARAVVEENLAPEELPLRLGLKPEQVQEGLKELLRRGVLRFPEAS